MTVRLFPDPESAASFMNELGSRREPFFFMTDFELRMPLVIPLDSYNPEEAGVLWKFPENSSQPDRPEEKIPSGFSQIHPVSEEYFTEKVKQVQEFQKDGRSYLLNLCFRSEVDPVNKDLSSVFRRADAPYCIYVRTDLLAENIILHGENPFFSDFCRETAEFTVFSPEPFIRICSEADAAVISATPMKGTIDAEIPDAGEKLLSDEKELAEHRTVTDLLRNDLGRVASQIRVEAFRYIEELKTSRGRVLQTSSRITGRLSDNWQSEIGTILFSMLPAGSVSGAPREETCRIIRETEPEPRGYYTGTAGIFTGSSLDSAVMIRFLEKNRESFGYRSGCGITIYSSPAAEYRELLNKIYVPVI